MELLTAIILQSVSILSLQRPYYKVKINKKKIKEAIMLFKKTCEI